ncbi:MAG: tRNA epoxyqueuosine(34) reductase QueG [Sedimentibacter sp.]|uniref:tRNA epoxyqueuosine(34) reductase QueG n=1 Tax=Sedimentibacter sp. TaxID=1960295 RepID=UPI00315989AD
MNIKDTIKEAAVSLGIESIGFTNVLDYSYLEENLRRRKAYGFESEFEEHDIEKRLDVRNVFLKCKSIIAVAVPYGVGYKKPSVADKGLLSVVAFGEDYHTKIRCMLEKLAKEIQKQFDFEYVICVDTSPLLDREVCRNANLGHQGKNTMLINNHYGSFVNLGYILTDIEMECEKYEEKDICGSCSLCMKSCPNKAITDSGIDTGRCISALTQTKKDIPYEYRLSMKNQLYGCDMCQLVCPRNKKVLGMGSSVDYSCLAVDLKEILTISGAEFAKKYGNTSGGWRGKNIWKRNALIAIGNLRLQSMYEAVEKELDSPSEMIRIYAAWSLLMLHAKKASVVLNNRLNNEKDKVRHEFEKLLEVYDDNWNMRDRDIDL